MQLPAFWWLLALTVCVQGGFFVRFCIVRIRRKEVQPVARSAAAVLFSSALAGLAYAVMQRDPLFFLGQGCLIVFYYRIQKVGHDK